MAGLGVQHRLIADRETLMRPVQRFGRDYDGAAFCVV
jgi:hypothetical protein